MIGSEGLRTAHRPFDLEHRLSAIETAIAVRLAFGDIRVRPQGSRGHASPATHHAKYLGEHHDRNGRPGKGLVESRLSGADGRSRMLSLTPKGELLALQIENVMAR